MKIRNINGTSHRTCACGSWLRHWEKFSSQTVTYCPDITCVNQDLVGAHVQKADSSDNEWYIYPLCNSHSHYAGSLEVPDFYELVTVNTEETCGG